MRKPGAALLAEMVAAVLSMLLGSQWGWGTAISGLMQGGGVELAFLLTRYRRFTLPVAPPGTSARPPQVPDGQDPAAGDGSTVSA